MGLELLKTPLAGLSNGAQEFGIFITAKPIACRSDADCSEGYVCDPGLGYVGTYYQDPAGLTLACIDGSSPSCHDDTMVAPEFPIVREVPAFSSFLVGQTVPVPAGIPVAGTGLCVDPTTSLATPDDAGRIASVVVRHEIGVRSTNRARYIAREWMTNRFLNPITATVKDFDPTRAGGVGNDYRTADGTNPAHEKVLIWGRPQFTSLNAAGRSLGLYLAYVDMPHADSTGHFDWSPRYFTGLDAENRATFSPQPRAAVPLDLSGGGGDPHEVNDVVNQMNVRYVAPLGKWVMFYGGGVATAGHNFQCAILACLPFAAGNGAIRMRVADHPWGPWSSPRDVLVAGDPDVPSGQYGPGGVLHHPDCADPSCAPHSPGIANGYDEHGFLYSPTIIEPWTKVRADGAVDLYWDVSSWDPYSVWLMRTRIDP